MENIDFNQLSRCADYINQTNTNLSEIDLNQLSSDDILAADAINIAEISAAATQKLNNKHNTKILSLIIIAAAAAIATLIFIPKTSTQQPNTPKTAFLATTNQQNTQQIIAKNNIATINFDFEATQTDTITIYDLNNNIILKKEIKGKSTIIAIPTTAPQKLIYIIEHNNTDILQKGTILTKEL